MANNSEKPGTVRVDQIKDDLFLLFLTVRVLNHRWCEMQKEQLTSFRLGANLTIYNLTDHQKSISG